MREGEGERGREKERGKGREREREGRGERERERVSIWNNSMYSHRICIYTSIKVTQDSVQTIRVTTYHWHCSLKKQVM